MTRRRQKTDEVSGTEDRSPAFMQSNALHALALSRTERALERAIMQWQLGISAVDVGTELWTSDDPGTIVGAPQRSLTASRIIDDAHAYDRHGCSAAVCRPGWF